MEHEVSGCSQESVMKKDSISDNHHQHAASTVEEASSAPALETITSTALTELLEKISSVLNGLDQSIWTAEDEAETSLSSSWWPPVICVMGDTSSGKSALLSQLMGLELPSRYGDITTKCPVKIQLKAEQSNNNDHKSNTTTSSTTAQVSIQWQHRANYNSSTNIFPEYKRDNIPLHQIGQAILDAQQVILQSTQKKQVASDIIQVTIAQQQQQQQQQVSPQHLQHDLTVIDLPGLVSITAEQDVKDNSNSNDGDNKVSDSGKEKTQIGAEIQELLSSFLQNPHCIIVAVLPANVDYHNSQIMAMASQFDPHTLRTLPVLTKPDLIDAGAEQAVLDLLLGKKLPCRLGFHMILGRGQAALDSNVSIAQAIRQEQDFFHSVEPWKSVQDRSLLGTAQLRNKLGDLQYQMIRDCCIPKMMNKIRTRRDRAEAVLAEMGNVQLLSTVMEKRRYYHQDVSQTLLAKIHSNLNGKGRVEVKNHVPSKNGSKKQPSAAAALHEACSEFMDRIREGSLNTISAVVEGAHVLVTSSRGAVRGEVVHLDEAFACVDCLDDSQRASGSVDVLFDAIGLQSLEPLEENDVWSDGSKVFIARKNNVYDMLRKIPLASIRTDPAWLKVKIAENRTDDLACFLNVDIFKSIVADFIEEDWRPFCTDLFERTRDIVLSAIREAIDATLLNDRYPQLRALVDRKCRDAAHALLKSAWTQMEAHLEIEKHPYTQDHLLFETIAHARHSNLKRELEVSMKLEQEGVFDTQAIQSIMDSVFERNRRKSVEDHMAEEMEIVLSSYGQIATRRVVDRIPMICWQVFRSLTHAIRDSLAAMTDDMLEQSMQESDAFFIKYKAATKELNAMRMALEGIESLL